MGWFRRNDEGFSSSAREGNAGVPVLSSLLACVAACMARIKRIAPELISARRAVA